MKSLEPFTFPFPLCFQFWFFFPRQAGSLCTSRVQEKKIGLLVIGSLGAPMLLGILKSQFKKKNK